MSDMKALQASSMLAGANSPYLEQAYEDYLRDPNSVAESWRSYFDTLPMVNNTSRDVPHSEVRDHFYQLTRRGGRRPNRNAADANSSLDLKQIYVTQLINSYRVRGHQHASLDPLGRPRSTVVREIQLHENGLSEADLDTVFATPSLEGIDQASLRDIIEHLEKTYCDTIGYEFMYVDHTTQKDWLQHRIESVASHPELEPKTQRWIMDRVNAAESMERHLHSRYMGQKRFSLEGGESLIVIMGELLRRGVTRGVKDMVIGLSLIHI